MAWWQWGLIVLAAGIFAWGAWYCDKYGCERDPNDPWGER